MVFQAIVPDLGEKHSHDSENKISKMNLKNGKSTKVHANVIALRYLQFRLYHSSSFSTLQFVLSIQSCNIVRATS